MQKVVYRGKQVTLTDREFLASGGQGSCYLHNGLVFKVYFNTLDSTYVSKLQELMILDHPNILRPLDILYNTNNQAIGFTLNYADNTVGLPLLFTTSFITRNNISLLDTQQLVSDMANTMKFVHSKGILDVDNNEFNQLIDKNGFRRSYFIDTDGYATKNHPATVIMPSIRDYTTTTFSKETSYYAYAVLTFQLFTGIHPYKGKHPTLKTMEERCRHHVSVFNKDVGTPPSVRDFSNIPNNYLDWYKDIFENGKRLPPPNMISAPQMRQKRKYVSAAFNIEKILTAQEAIKSVEWLYGNLVVMTENFLYVNGKEFDRHHPYSVVIASQDGVLYEVYFNDTYGMILIDILKKYTLPDGGTYRASKWFSINGRLYSIYESQLFEFEIRKMGGNILPVVIHTQPIHEQSAQTFAGVVYANIFGKAYFYIPCASKAVNVYQQPVLDGKRIIDVKYDREQMVVIAAESDGTIKRWRMAVTGDGSLQIEADDISMQETNTTVLSNGISITYDSVEDQIDLAPVGQMNHKIIKDAGLPAGATLVSTGTTAHYFVDDSLYKFSVK